ncbi:tetratricopeptide repeat protein [Pseudomonas sp. CCOS 191]|uniref:tetratricopeptide repeat protein n=1 Tax=Pseudomonas sp. CCOS 191 TaxID=1649877 RepID=UPI0012E044F4|nr:hypothetical protein [Pseudomonas sp. CCOS 191]
MAKAPRKQPAREAASTQKTEARGRRKNVSSPVSSGGRGDAFQLRVQAVRLLSMCLGLECPGAPAGFHIIRMVFQGRVFGHNTDDLIIDLMNPVTGQTAKHRLQMKRSLKPGDNAQFNESVGLAWEDFSKPDFQRGLDECQIVFNSSCHSQMQGAVEVVRFAMASEAAADWIVRVFEEGFSNDSNRKAYGALRNAVELQKGSPVDSEELHQFLMHLRFMSHDLDSDHTQAVATQKQLISQRLPNRKSAEVWALLQAACVELNSTAGQITQESAERHLGELGAEFKETRELMRALHDLQSARPGGVNHHVSAHPNSALPLSPEAHGHLLPLAQLLQPFFASPVTPQGASMTEALPGAHATSTNLLVTRQLDRITQMQKEHRYQECLNQLDLLQPELEYFDDHQKARWYLLHGLSLWHMDDDDLAAKDFDIAASLCDSDDRIAVAAVRSHIIRGDIQAAVEAGQALMVRFPESFAVWIALTNARIIAGERISEDEIPDAFAGKAVAWQLVASSHAAADDDESAVRISLIALEQEDSSIFILESYLRFVLRLVTLNPVRVNCRALQAEHAQLLMEAMARADIRDGTFWACQSPKTLGEIVVHLAYGMILLERAEAALELLQQAKLKGVYDTAGLIRFEVEALCDLNRWSDLITRFGESIGTLPDDSLLRFGHACVLQSRADLLQRVRDEAAQRPESDVIRHVSRRLQHLHWDQLLDQGELGIVQKEIEQAGLSVRSTSSLVDLQFVARAYAHDEVVAKAVEDQVTKLAPGSTDPHEIAMGARVMLRAERFDIGAELLERLLPSDMYTELHDELLYCYIRTSRHAKARDLLDAMPIAWRDSAKALELALFLYNNAGDWGRMRPIVEHQLSLSPQSASEWIKLIRVVACEGVTDLKTIISSMPTCLGGAVEDLLLLANIELRYGQIERGLNRVCAAIRTNPGNSQAAETHVKMVLMLREGSEVFQQEPVVVAPGTSVELADAQGVTRYISIDFEAGAYPPGAAEFLSPQDDFAQTLMGLTVGESITVPDIFSFQVFEVRRIITLHRRLFDLSKALLSDSIVPGKTLVSLKFPLDANGEMDFTLLQEQHNLYQARTAALYELYAQKPVPLALLAKKVGRDVIDMVRDWPSDAPCLDVSIGDVDADDKLPFSLDDRIWVVDLSILAELATLGLLDVLEHLPKVYVSAVSRQALDAKIEISSFLHSGGLESSEVGQEDEAYEDEPSIDLSEGFLGALDMAISNYCTVVPAYGSHDPNLLLQRFNGILSAEGRATLSLCQEHQASLISLDGRLLQIAQMHDISSATLQMLLTAITEKGGLRPVETSCALIKMVIARRSFIAIRPDDLVAMMDQGLLFANLGINSFRRYLAEPNLIFHSAASTIIDFICKMFTSVRCTFSVFLKLIELLLEPTFRHVHRPEDWDAQALQAFRQLQHQGLPENYFAHIRRSLAVAKDNARSPCMPVSLEAQVTFSPMTLFYWG